jgi:hypothetical protein
LNSAGRLDDPVWAAAGLTFKLVFKTSAGVQIGPTWDNIPGINDTSALGITYFAGTSAGTANVQTLTFSNGPSAYAQGNEFLWKAGITNTGAMTLNVNGLGAKTLKKQDTRDLVGGEVISGRWYRSVYDGTYLSHEALDNQTANRVDVTCAATIDLDAADSEYVRITGSTGPVIAITLTNGHECDVVFDSTPTLTNGASLILPGGQDIVVAAGDTASFRGEASGVVRCLHFTRAAGITSIVFEGATADAFETTLTATDPTADRTVTIPDATGTIPLRIDAVTATTEVVSSAAETAVYTKSIAGGTLGTDGALRLTLIGDFFNNSGGNQDLVVKVKYGATTVLNFIFTAIVGAATRKSILLTANLHAKAATNAQVAAGYLMIDAATATQTSATVAAFRHIGALAGHNACAIDSTAAQDLVVTIQHSASDANLSFKTLSARLELIR